MNKVAKEEEDKDTIKVQSSKRNDHRKRQIFLPHVPLYIHQEEKHSCIFSPSRREMTKFHPSQTIKTVIARFIVLDNMMFVSLETSPLEPRQG